MKTPRVQSSVVTRWNSAFEETECANANQHNLDVAIKRIIAPGGAIEKLRINNDSYQEVDENGITEAQWRIYAQYKGAMRPMKSYSTACQTANVFVHEKLFWLQSTIQALMSPYFFMHENLSALIDKQDLRVSNSLNIDMNF